MTGCYQSVLSESSQWKLLCWACGGVWAPAAASLALLWSLPEAGPFVDSLWLPLTPLFFFFAVGEGTGKGEGTPLFCSGKVDRQGGVEAPLFLQWERGLARGEEEGMKPPPFSAVRGRGPTRGEEGRKTPLIFKERSGFHPVWCLRVSTVIYPGPETQLWYLAASFPFSALNSQRGYREEEKVTPWLLVTLQRGRI